MSVDTEVSVSGGELFREQYMYKHPPVSQMKTDLKFSDEDKAVLRRLAEKVAAIAEREDMKFKKKLWTENHDLKSSYPVIFVDPENGWNEILTDDVFECKDPLARTWENTLRKDIYSAEMIKDDRVITKDFNVPWYYTDDGFGITPKIEYTGQKGGSYHVLPAIEDYEEDFPKMHFPKITVDREKSQQVMDLAKDTFGDILNCRFSMKWHWADDYLNEFVAFRGMEDFMCDFVTEPEWIERMMQFMTDGIMKRFDDLEEQGLLSLNNDNTYLGTGGQGYTTDLPAADFVGKVRTKDMWVTLQAQETVSCNPDMFGKFILPHFIRLAERFGLAHYGCCEPYDVRWKYLKQIPHLRHVSVSPWADYRTVPDYLGKDYIASVKLKPTPLAMPDMNEEYVRKECRRAVEETYGGICEFIMKDNHTIGNNPNNLIRWTQIMREEIERKY